MNSRAEYYDYLSDQFEYASSNLEECIRLGNQIIHECLHEKDKEVLESMFHALVTLLSFHNIADRLDTDILADHAFQFDKAILNYMLPILSSTGNLNYQGILEQIHHDYPDLDVEETLVELEYIAEHQR